MAISLDLATLLKDLERGDASARERLWPLVYDELHALATRAMRKERTDHTLQATALVHEAYLRLADGSQLNCTERAHFLATAAGVIRHILVDHARAHMTDKRGGKRNSLSLTAVDSVATGGHAAATGWGGTPGGPGDPATRAVDVLALDEALRELGRLSERQARVVELRFFAGLDVDETATVLGVSPRTVKGDWRVARAWLAARLGDDDREPATRRRD